MSKNRFIKSQSPIIGVLFILLTMQSCKSFNKFYHDITARFNGYYNAKTKLDENIQQIHKLYKDDYTKILPVFKINDKATAKSNTSTYDEVMKKCSNVIDLHPKSKWTDDCYFLVGKSFFHKHEYFDAIETFLFIYGKYKKEPIAQEALVWLARAYTETQQYSKAKTTLDQVLANKILAQPIRSQAYAAYGDLLIKSNNLAGAAEKLVKSLSYTTNKKDLARYNYALGQVYQKLNKKREAITAFRVVLSKNPSYDMGLNARLSIARMYDAIIMPGYNIKDELKRLARDDKNIAFRSEIYYELGSIYQREKNATDARKYFRLSINTSEQNAQYKSLSYLGMATLDFNAADYQSAEIFYDSTITFLKTDHPEYKQINARKTSLSDLIKNLKIIKEEDSLLKLSGLSEDKLVKLAKKQLQYEEDEKVANLEKEKIELDKLNRQAFPDTTKNNPFGNIISSGNTGWYFYNPQAVTQGYADFISKWGNRRLEDNWRRNKKEVNNTGTENLNKGTNDSKEETSIAKSKGDNVVKNLSKEELAIAAMIKRIPKSPQEQENSREKITQAMFNLGMIFRDKINDKKEAIAAFEALLLKFPQNKYRLECLFALYNLYEAVPDKKKSDYYKNTLLNESAESNYAKLISDPDFYKKQKSTEKESSDTYASAYSKYNNGDYTSSLALCNETLFRIPDSKNSARFQLLKGMNQIKLGDKENAIVSLTLVITKYKSDPTASLAQKILEQLTATTNKTTPIQPLVIKPTIVDTSIYTFETGKRHWFLILLPMNDDYTRGLDIKIVDFNTAYFSSSKLKIESSIDGVNMLFLVKDFADEKRALDYFEKISVDPLFTGLPTKGTLAVVIDPANYTLMLKTKKYSEYKTFFDKNYRTKKEAN